MSRFAHYLRPNHTSESPSNAIWFDTETRPEPAGENTIGHRLDFGWACYRRIRTAGAWTAPDWTRFTTRREFWDWVVERTAAGKRLYLFCHNTSFDLPVLDVFHELPRRGWRLVRAIIDAPPTIIQFRRGKASILILDTLNHWRLPLKKVGEMVGLAKLEMPPAGAAADAWNEYSRRDVEIIMRACLQWWELLKSQDMGSFAPTLASQALRTWRHRYMTERVLVHTTDDLLRMERESYHGGRVECFRRGTYRGKFFLLDVNSLYPAVMRAEFYPTRVAFRRQTTAGWPWTDYAARYACIGRVVLRTSEPAYPVVRDGKLVFPVGTFPAVLCGPELLYAQHHGHLAETGAMAFYEQAPIFRGFVEDLYARRLQAKAAGNATLDWFYKILMNSLYGKFGQNGKVWHEQENVTDLSARAWKEVDAQTGAVVSYRQLGGLVQRLAAEPEAPESIPAIAAYVTSHARLHLWRLICHAGRSHVYYCDTDSLLVDEVGYGRLAGFIHATRLGALKLESKPRHVVLYGAKDYVIGARRKIKGVRASARWLDPLTVSQERWRGLRGQVQDGQADMPTTSTVVKTLTRHYTKGRTGATGRVYPLVLTEGAAAAAPSVAPGARAAAGST